VDEHLVDDDLGEQRRQQGKELQEERRDENLARSVRYLTMAGMNQVKSNVRSCSEDSLAW